MYFLLLLKESKWYSYILIQKLSKFVTSTLKTVELWPYFDCILPWVLSLDFFSLSGQPLKHRKDTEVKGEGSWVTVEEWPEVSNPWWQFVLQYQDCLKKIKKIVMNVR